MNSVPLIGQRTAAFVVAVLILCLGQTMGQWHCADGSLCRVCASLSVKSADNCGMAPGLQRENCADCADCADCCHFEVANLCRAADPRAVTVPTATLAAVLPFAVWTDARFSVAVFAPLFAQPPPANRTVLWRRSAPRGPPFIS